MEINKSYEPQKIEKKWYKHWIDNGYFTPKIDKNKKPYTVLIPPPNVTNILHMGHVLNNTLQDVMIRYKRMTGIPTLWLPGVDHAGIATQNMVEKELAKEGKTRHEIGREELIKRIWKWKENKGGLIIEQLKQLGCSCDWTKQRFTLDEGLSEAVKEVFVKLYEKGLIYKGKRIINWCPRCHTALSNDEVEHEDEKGFLWDLKYPLKDGNGYVTVATTRPETMLGDTAVAVNPKDKRYINLIGKTVILPFIGREIPIIADEFVEMEFGSGCVKVTPAHDPNDYEIGMRHDLEQIIVIDEHGIMNENASKKFEGLGRFEAREKIVNGLKEKGFLGEIKTHEHTVGQCYRCDTIIEPYLSDQWFVKMKPLAERAIEVVKEGKVKFQPARWTKVYYHWMENVRDWCISRQIWWGHRIPVYYCQNCDEIVVAKAEPTTCPKCGHNEFKQDEDVLDTWFSSWLWPFSTFGWPDETEELDYFLPTNLLVTAPDIIYLWVARMIMATLEFKDKIPFDTVLLHGMVRDEKGIKMSKSLGNSPDPLDIIENVGADALRFSIIFASPKGQDSYYSNSILETGRNFANKIWNAYRFIMMNAEKIEGLPKRNELKLELADQWIYSRLNEVIEETRRNYESLRFNDAANILMDFIWKEFCSWYLELSKDRIYNEDNREAQLTAKYILLDVLQNSMRQLQPIMPFISEEIWQGIKHFFPMEEETIVLAAFPLQNKNIVNKKIDKDMKLIQEAIVAIRNLRKQVNISPGKEVSVFIKVATADQIQLLKDYRNYFTKLAKISKMEIAVDLQKPKSSIAAVVQNMEIYLPLEGLIDLDGEREKLNKQIAKLEIELKKINGKLNDSKFITNAPELIVEKEKQK
ncbi:MAG: valine--tRNA ligase [Candidatus Cloacimonetes bacterium]|jgi:valyl-tRNA synthetase|nr:valine--tRNA ligase [Candidatus Cloacimonadota bacterium]